MSPTGIFALLLTALLIDWMSIGPDSVRDRVAFCLALPAIRAGWDGSPVDKQTVAVLAGFVDQAKRTGNATLAQASTATLVGVLVGGLVLYCVGCLLPDRAAGRLGPWARLAFRGGRGPAATPGGPAGPRVAAVGRYRLNGRLWACAWLLGLLAELPGGLIGQITLAAVDGLTSLVAPVPNILFGAS